MPSLRALVGAIAGLSLLAPVVHAANATEIESLIIVGKHFFWKSNGTEFFIRGVAYQQDYDETSSTDANSTTTYTDPLADITTCNRDIPYMQQLTTNVVRTYAVDPNTDHSACMNALAEAGIYVISDLSSPDESIDRDDPKWTTTLYARYVSLIANLAQYNNTIGFFAGNEVSNSYNTTAASAFVKAAVRDSKAFIKSQGYRPMYVGYATYDGNIRDELADYFNCGDTEDSIDMWGYNVYSWCGDSNYVESGYQSRTEFFANYSVPAFFAEYGCNTEGTRTWEEVTAIYGYNMTPVWSGAIAYEWFQAANDYGLVSVIDSTSISLLPDFTSLSARMATASPSSTALSDYITETSTLTARACPTLDEYWSATATPLPPYANAELCSCMVESLDCVLISTASVDDYAELFSYICGEDATACDGIDTNGTTGVYGAYSGCTSEQQLSYVMNRYYLLHDSASTACDFSGNATTTSGATAATCSTLLVDAGTNGGGTVASPTGTASYSETSTGTGTGTTATATAASSSTSKAGAAGRAVGMGGAPITNMYVGFQVALYVLGAAVTGVGMIVL